MKKNNFDQPTYKDLDVVENQYPDRDYVINVSIPEFNCVCPKTGLPDFGTITINYVPKKYIVELKSLKLYIVKFRNMGIYHESATNKIFKDFQESCHPKQIEVIGEFSARGGISTIVKVNSK